MVGRGSSSSFREGGAGVPGGEEMGEISGATDAFTETDRVVELEFEEFEEEDEKRRMDLMSLRPPLRARVPRSGTSLLQTRGTDDGEDKAGEGRVGRQEGRRKMVSLKLGEMGRVSLERERAAETYGIPLSSLNFAL